MDLPVAHGILCRDEPACQAETGVLASSLDGIQKRMREHTIELRIRYDEVDPMGFVHHSNYLKFFEIGRTELLRLGRVLPPDGTGGATGRGRESRLPLSKASKVR